MCSVSVQWLSTCARVTLLFFMMRRPARANRPDTRFPDTRLFRSDSMSNVTASRGVLDPASDHLLPEAEIVCRMAMATLPGSQVDWASYIDDYGRIRDKIAEVYPAIYTDFGARIADPRGFHLDIPPRRRVWPTPNRSEEHKSALQSTMRISYPG